MFHLARTAVHAIDGITLTKCDVQIAGRTHCYRTRAIHGSPFLALEDRVDDSGREIDSPDPIITDVAHKQPLLGVEGDAMRLPHLRFRRRSFIARESLLAGTSD